MKLTKINTMKTISRLLTRSSLIPLFAGMSFTAHTHAALIAYEGFDYTAGSSLNGQNGGTGWNDDSWTERAATGSLSITDGGLSYPGIASSGNAGFTSGTGTNLNYRYADNSETSVAATLGLLTASNQFGVDDTTIWISYLLREDANPSYKFFGLELYKPGVGDAGTTGLNLTRIPTAGDEAPGKDQWEIGNGNNRVKTGVERVDGETFLFVAKIDFTSTTDTVSLFINPEINGPSPSITNAFVTLTDLEFSGFRIAGTNLAAHTIDEIRIGTTFTDVTAVPEPAVVGCIMGVTGLLFMMVRRRRR